MVTSAKSAVPTVADQSAAMQLGQCAKTLATCLAELRTATQKVSQHNTIKAGLWEKNFSTPVIPALLFLLPCLTLPRPSHKMANPSLTYLHNYTSNSN